MEKICSKCKLPKNIDEFFKDSHLKDGYESKCKLCKKQYKQDNWEMISKSNKKYETKNKEKIQKYQQEYNIKNKDKVKVYKEEYFQKHKEEHKERGKKWRKNNPDKLKIINARHYKSDKAKITRSKWEKENYEIRKIQKREYKRKQLQDPQERIKANLRNRIYKTIKNGVKSARTLELLGCDIPFYKQYMQPLFTPEMTWENYGTYWEIDHIIPCCSFDLEDHEQQRQCFHYSNTQPLTIEENRSKGGNLI